MDLPKALVRRPEGHAPCLFHREAPPEIGGGHRSYLAALQERRPPRNAHGVLKMTTERRIPETISAALATTASGFGAVIDGVLNIRTVSETQNAAAVNAAHLKGLHVMLVCHDPDCACIVRAVIQRYPDIKIVPVRVEVQHD
ncbi:hypothetical protein [Paracoccus sp. KR1-242]|uniref:hypothetical protein n=1 Tax=Paracoccus sp. KR1-242 TaxID=3410028 RepID=UPI003C1149A0